LPERRCDAHTAQHGLQRHFEVASLPEGWASVATPRSVFSVHVLLPLEIFCSHLME
jgi:hypothetical protein